ncbi:MAG: SdpI family protein [Clostridia bacterium]|nr:SdpI family protein [Clostridia bacterium]
MGFWFFMLIMDFLIPTIMVGFGSRYIKHAPKEINELSGYRTTMSMKNMDTWQFAHHYLGKLWRTVGWVVLALSLATMIFVFGKSKETIGIWGGILCGVQIVITLLSIIPTEVALRKNFDENGHRS